MKFLRALLFLGQIGISGCCLAGSKDINSFYSQDYDKKQVEVFMKRLKEAVNKNDRIGVSKIIKYPLTTYDNGKKVKIKNEKEFLNKFETIFNVYIKNVIKRYSAGDNDYKPEYGVIINSGAIIIYMTDQKPREYKMWCVNNELYKTLKWEEKNLK